MKRIAVIGLKGLPAFGGAATVGENIIRELHQDFHFTVFSVQSHADKKYQMGSVRQVILPSFFIKKLNVLVYYLISCFKVLLSNQFDLVHLHHTDAAFIVPLLRLRYKVIVTSHARPQDCDKWSGLVKFFFDINEWLAVRFASEMTTVSKSLKGYYEERYKITVHYIPNGIDIDIADGIESSADEEPYILFAAGRILPLKGLHLLLQALKKIGYSGRLKIVGNLDQVPEYKKEILQLSEGLNTQFIGLIKEKKELLRIVKNAQLFVFPSLTEAMSIMLLEVVLMKTHLIASDISANTNVFDPDEVLFFKTEDVEDLVRKLTFYFDNRQEMTERAIKAYNKLLKSYQWKEIATQYSELYTS